MARQPQPAIIGEKRRKLRRQKAVLGEQMAGTLAPLGHRPGFRGVEEHHRLCGKRAALGGAKRQHIDAGLPGDLRRTGVEPDQRIGKARAVHMHPHAMVVRKPGQRRDLIRPIDGAGLARLRERKRRRHDLVWRVAFIATDRRGERLRRHLAADTRHADELEPAAEELRRAAFIGQDMRLAMREHRAPRRAHMRERQRIGGGAGRHQEYGDVVLEQFRDAPLDVPSQIVIAIAQHEAFVGPHQGIENFRSHARGVVTCKVHPGDPRWRSLAIARAIASQRCRRRGNRKSRNARNFGGG